MGRGRPGARFRFRWGIRIRRRIRGRRVGGDGGGWDRLVGGLPFDEDEGVVGTLMIITNAYI